MATKKKVKSDNGNKPWVDNYPPLRDWLNKHEARCMWQIPLNERPSDAEHDWAPQAYVECYLISGRRLVIVVVHANKGGWDIYTDANTNKIAETLADAEQRLGIADPKCPGCGWSISAVAKTVNCDLGSGCKCGSARVAVPDKNVEWTAQQKARIIIERSHSEHECNTAEDAEELAKLVLGVDE